MLAHEILGLRADASQEEIRHRFRELAQIHHPDHGGDRDEFVRIKAAYDAMTSGSPDLGFGSTHRTEEAPRHGQSDEWFSRYKDDLRHQWESAAEAVVEPGAPTGEGASYLWMVLAVFAGAGYATWRAVDRGAPSDFGSVTGQGLINGLLILLPSLLCSVVGGGSDEGQVRRMFFYVAGFFSVALALIAPLPGFRPERNGSPYGYRTAEPASRSVPVSGPSGQSSRRAR